METTMLSPDRIPDFEPLHTAASDYDIVRRAIGFISEQWRKQPEVEDDRARCPASPRPSCITCSGAGPG